MRKTRHREDAGLRVSPTKVLSLQGLASCEPDQRGGAIATLRSPAQRRGIRTRLDANKVHRALHGSDRDPAGAGGPVVLELVDHESGVPATANDSRLRSIDGLGTAAVRN